MRPELPHVCLESLSPRPAARWVRSRGADDSARQRYPLLGGKLRRKSVIDFAGQLELVERRAIRQPCGPERSSLARRRPRARPPRSWRPHWFRTALQPVRSGQRQRLMAVRPTARRARGGRDLTNRWSACKDDRVGSSRPAEVAPRASGRPARMLPADPRRARCAGRSRS